MTFLRDGHLSTYNLMFKSFSAIAALVGTTAANVNENFKTYLHGEKPVDHAVFMDMWRSYERSIGKESPNSAADEFTRLNNFEASVHRVIEHNSQPGVAYKKGINTFSDMSDEEFRAHYQIKELGVEAEQHCSATGRQSVAKVTDLPTTWDWRDHNGVSPVKD